MAWYICIEGAVFGEHRITEGSIVMCDDNNPYIHAMADNGIISLVRISSGEIATIETPNSGWTAVGCGLIQEPRKPLN